MDSHFRPAWQQNYIQVRISRLFSLICKSDPLVLNELGVLYFQKFKYVQSVDSFKNALKVAEETKCRPQVWKQHGLILAMLSGSLASWILLNHISKK
ncbi:ApcC hetero-tetramer Cut9-Hcn1 [Gigaspora margarita]|uniref:ApcC hetero-tetramer Cut9-Hcn1 n=1 Tax=Gigaspora margarita TaxID=4874 RepID=A0A8H4AHH6_GIGMA|nr:ApcC hetero-tetramer Cut9-Hcn1 [Gigaspora margarita]